MSRGKAIVNMVIQQNNVADVLNRPSKDIANFPCVEEGSLNVKDACVDGVKVQVEVHSQLNSVWNKNKGENAGTANTKSSILHLVKDNSDSIAASCSRRLFCEEIAGTVNNYLTDRASSQVSEQRQFDNELEDFTEDSDCSVKDKDYVPESESSDEESAEDTFSDIQIKSTAKEVPTHGDTSNTTVNSGTKRSRWKKSDPSQWKKNINKRQKIEMKAPRPIDCSKCRFKCSDRISAETRLELCKNYWKCDFVRRKDFILNNVESNIPIRRRVIRNSNKKARTDSKSFFFSLDTRVRVCKSFFIKTLCISKEVIDHALKNKGDGRLFSGSDKRGKHEPSNKTKLDDIQKVKDHIESFPVMESHYTRKSTKRLYLDSKLSINKMYSLYRELCETDGSKPVSSITYRRIFCTNYNYSFYKPKKDQCQTCMQYETCKDVEKKKKLEDDYQAHIVRKEDCYSAKARDKERASSEKKFVCCTFDLQCVLQIPTSDVSPMYYSRKICTYNLTIYEMTPPNAAFCYVWTELNGKRWSSEIGTCLYTYINQQLSDDVTELSLFSDTCSGQNRNQNMSALLLYLVQSNPKLEVIEQKFLESGHTYMEVDSMHSAIEKAQKFVPVYTIHDWLNIFRMARTSKSNKKPYQVKELKYNDFLDLEKLSKLLMKNKLKNTTGEKVNWLKVKCFRYLKAKPWILQYRYDHSSEYMEINVLGKGRPLNFKEIEIAKAYTKIRPLSIQKKKDLLKLCKTNVIPEEFHHYYKSIPTSSQAEDVVPGPAAEDSDPEEDLVLNEPEN